MRNKFFSIIFAVVILSASVFAGTPQTQQGAKALYFGFNGLSELSVNNTYIGGQYLFADNLAVFGDLSLGFKTTKENKGAEDITDNNIGFNLGISYYLFQKGTVAMYLSPQFGFSSGNYEDENTKIKTTNNKFDVGVSFGVEWWAFDNISFAVSTLVGFKSTKTTVKNDNNNLETESTSTKIGMLGSSAGTIYILYYF